MAIEFESQYSGKDYLSLRRSLFRVFLKPGRMILDTLFVAAGMYIVMDNAVRKVGYAGCGCHGQLERLSLAAVYAVCITGWSLMRNWLQISRQLSDHCNALVGVDVRTTFRLDQNRYVSNSAESSFDLPWARIMGYYETGRVFCLRSKTDLLHVIPKLGLSQEQVEEIGALLLANSIRKM